MMPKTVRVEAIENGTVIDHIPAGKAMRAWAALRLPDDATAAITINVNSTKLGRKDIIFLTDRELSVKDVAKVGLVARGATLNIVRSGKVARKEPVQVPREVTGFLRCINPNCVTNHEKVPTRFSITLDPQLGLGKERVSATCRYCERSLSEQEFAMALQ